MTRVSGSFGRPKVSGDAILVAEASGLGQHPKLKTELGKHQALEKAKQSSVAIDHVKRLQRIRELMATDPSLSFDAAFSRIIEQESNPPPAVKTASTVNNGHEKMLLIQGANAGLAFNIHTGKRAA